MFNEFSFDLITIFMKTFAVHAVKFWSHFILTFLKYQMIFFAWGIDLWGLITAIVIPNAEKSVKKGTLIFGQILDS